MPSRLFLFSTVQVSLHDLPMQLESEYLSSKYTFEQLHFHWGSEHTIDYYRYPLEMHLVHYNDQYNNVSIASEHKNGIVVVTVLFKVNTPALYLPLLLSLPPSFPPSLSISLSIFIRKKK